MKTAWVASGVVVLIIFAALTTTGTKEASQVERLRTRDEDNRLHYVSLKELNKSPDAFHGKRVEVSGLWKYDGWETSRLYLEQSEPTVSDFESSVLVAITPQLSEEALKLNDKTVIIIGRFESHAGQDKWAPRYLGSLGHVESIELDPTETTRSR